ncbi:type VI secretion system ImpA family N-terminal domain-containing protein [Paraburkholderia bryophila]|uniref:type VI secretion system ImpA family N-terminal domain-containing protein n=1 Tax=Burkholderiaceae TaxID=119060 RepID=UPI0006916B11|nr:type VI secretion system ImpA family N-terminal domain-containing protein [Burkholderia sp. 9120]
MEHPLDYANGFLSAAYGMTFATLLAPVSIAQPQGETLRGTPLWQAIRRAREADDASLPLGAWVRQLKRANWGEVASGSLDALAYRSKDLHLAVWLTEALLHEHGFAGLAAGVAVVDALCERYWDVLYPGAADGDFEHRANLFRWLNEKLIAPVRLVPLTVVGSAALAANGAGFASAEWPGGAQQQSPMGEPERLYAWTDCEQLRRQQQSPQSGSRGGDDEGGVDAADFDKALAATSTEVFIGHHAALSQALAALAKLGGTLDQCFDGDPPGVGALRGVLEQIHAFVSAQLVQRGMPFGVATRVASVVAAAPTPEQGHGYGSHAEAGVVPLTETISVAVSMAAPVNVDGGAYSAATAANGNGGAYSATTSYADGGAHSAAVGYADTSTHPAAAANVDSGTQAAGHHAPDHAATPTLRDEASALPHSVSARKRAYAQLADAAAALAELEPHSPVPYLIRKAVEWGTLNTAQLYDELFIQGRGQLNVFDLLGLGVPQTEEQAS